MGLVPLEDRVIHKDFSYDLEFKPGNPLNPLIKALAILLLEPALILIWGTWKVGKSDFALLLSEIALANNMVGAVSTNIGQDAYEQIKDLDTLKLWLHGQNQYSDIRELIKLFAFDELNVHAPSRRSMSRKSVGIETILPEVSKAKARMFVICQNPREIDKVLKDRTWLKGGFYKESLKTAYLFCDRISLRRIPFKNIPPSHIEFDPYLTAPMTLKPEFDTLDLENEELRQLYMYARGLISARDIYEHPQKWNRHYRRWLVRLIEYYSYHRSKLDGGVIIGENKEKTPDKIREPNRYTSENNPRPLGSTVFHQKDT